MKKDDYFDEQHLLDVLNGAGRPLRLDDILRLGAFSRRLKRDILEALQDLARNGEAVRLEGGSWVMADHLKRRRGILAIQRSGAAFVTPEEARAREGQDIYIAPEHVGDAWNGDLVDVMLLPMKRGARRGPEGRVVAVVRRGCTDIVVRVLRPGEEEHTALCRPADSRLSFDVLADVSALDHAPEEQELLRVTVGEKLDDTGRRPLWTGKAVAALGLENDAAVQERLTKLNNGIPTEFPDNVLAEAEAVSSAPLDDAGLEDLRKEMLVTIDGEDARDFDDAVCVSRTEEGWRLLVAIADVSHYVRPKTALDREARERGNSYYFPTSVEPMLPEALCNGVCSLRPGEERRCMAVDMLLDDEGNLKQTRFFNAVMVSHARLTYREVQGALDDALGKEAADMEERAPGLTGMLHEAAALAQVLMERRKRQGGLDFDVPEAEFLVEEHDGMSRVSGIRNRERLFSHRIIEAFMVRANEAVAEFLTRRNAPLLYRVHPAPGPEKLEELYHALRATDAELPLPRAAKSTVPGWVTHVLDAAAGTAQAFIVSRLALRSMMQARYSPEEDGHFGLASACYCHFTSPIRRYADLVNHRALRYALGLDTGGALPAGHKLLEVAEQCNGRERVATDAEREISRRMGCLLLQGRTGETFEGVISGVMNFGFFVELDGMPVEGMVRVETLGRDYYVFDEERQELRGEHGGESFRLGQRVTVTLAGVHVGRLEIDLEYRKEDEEGRRPFRRRKDAHGGPRSEGNEGREHRSGRRAFADRKGFRPRRDDDEELRRQRRYASDSWGEDNGHEERPFRRREAGPAKPRFSQEYRNEENDGDSFRPGRRPFRKPGFRPDRERFERDGEKDFHGEGRPFPSRRARPAFHEEERRDAYGEEERRPFRPARPRFHEEDGERGRRSFRPGRREEERERFSRDGRRGERPRRPFRDREEGRDFSEERSFRPFHDHEEHRAPRDFHDRREGPRPFRHDEEGRPFHDHPRRKGLHPRKEGRRDEFHGAPEDFFAMHTESEKTAHRFGKRRK